MTKGKKKKSTTGGYYALLTKIEDSEIVEADYEH